jgi:hypothetical protein
LSTTTALFHSSAARRTPEEDKDDDTPTLDTSSIAGRIWTDELLAEIHHYRQREISALNMFLTHPATPRVLGWYYPEGSDPVSLESTTAAFLDDPHAPMEADEEEETLFEMMMNAPIVRRPRPRWSCLNRNARYGKKANQGKRPVSRQARRRKKRKIGNHRR